MIFLDPSIVSVAGSRTSLPRGVSNLAGKHSFSPGLSVWAVIEVFRAPSEMLATGDGIDRLPVVTAN